MNAFLVCLTIVASIAIPCGSLVALCAIRELGVFGRRMAWAFRGWKPIQQTFVSHCDFDEADDDWEGRIDPGSWKRN